MFEVWVRMFIVVIDMGKWWIYNIDRIKINFIGFVVEF